MFHVAVRYGIILGVFFIFISMLMLFILQDLQYHDNSILQCHSVLAHSVVFKHGFVR